MLPAIQHATYQDGYAYLIIWIHSHNSVQSWRCIVVVTVVLQLAAA